MKSYSEDLVWLMKWYYAQCNGNWEESYGIKLETTENSGWYLFVRILDTNLENVILSAECQNINESPELYCFLDDGAFHGYCSRDKTLNLLEIFRSWAEPYSLGLVNIHINQKHENSFEWLLNWYNVCCLNKLASSNRIQIGTLENPGWTIDINLEKTNLNPELFDKILLNRSENDWIGCYSKNGFFIGNTGPFNFFECLDVFQSWVERQSCEKM